MSQRQQETLHQNHVNSQPTRKKKQDYKKEEIKSFEKEYIKKREQDKEVLVNDKIEYEKKKKKDKEILDDDIKKYPKKNKLEELKELEDNDAFETFTHEGCRSFKRWRIQQLQSKECKNMSPRYTCNSKKEELCLEYVFNFQKQFEQLYPHREPLFITPLNEYEIPKFVCTTICPTELPYLEFYDYEKCAEFVSNIMDYEPLESFSQCPLYLPSGTALIEWCVGDSFDFSTLLVSFLCGVGYDAYVVKGKAPKWICLRDQTKTIYPKLLELKENENQLLSSHKTKKNNKKMSEEKLDSKNEPCMNYKIKEKGELRKASLIDPKEHKYDSSDTQEKKKKNYELVYEDDDDDDQENNDENDIATGIHAWVLIRAGRRKIMETFFIEPSTGRSYSLKGSPYCTIESIWNHHNYWVNMQDTTVLSSMQFDLRNSKLWENVFFENPVLFSSSRTTSTAYSPYTFPTNDTTISANTSFSETTTTSIPASTTTNNTNEATPPTPITPTPAVSESTPSLTTPKLDPTWKDFQVKPLDDRLSFFLQEDDESKTTLKDENILDVPSCWVSNLIIERELFRKKYFNNGQRTILYYKSKLELFADGIHEQGLVQRYTTFQDTNRSIPLECHETFLNRRDKLQYRIRYLLQGKIIEHFLPGRMPEALKDRIEWPGRKRELHFYTSARMDGLVSRTEILQQKIIEIFSGRGDRLIYRSVRIADDQETISGGKTSYTLPGGTLGELVLQKMTEKFSSNQNQKEKGNKDTNFAKRVYRLKEGIIEVHYHYEPGKIIAAKRIYSKSPDVPVQVIQANPQHPAIKESILMMDKEKTFQSERDCYTSIRHSEIEMQELLKTRKREETTILLDVNIFEMAKINAKKVLKEEKTTNEDDEKDTRKVDYLTPFLNCLDPNGKGLTQEEALKARDSCLKAFKDRVLERANVIQKHLDEENNQLAKKQVDFQRNQRDNEQKESEEFEKLCTDAMFRIQILEQRLARHEETALEKYADLDAKLHNDPRLASLQ